MIFFPLATTQAQEISLSELKNLRSKAVAEVQNVLYQKGFSLYSTWRDDDLKQDSVIYRNAQGHLLGSIHVKNMSKNRIFLELSEPAFYEQTLDALKKADYKLVKTEVGKNNTLTNSYIRSQSKELVQVIISNDPESANNGNSYRLLIRPQENKGLRKKILGNN